MWKSIFIVLCILLCATVSFAQTGYLTPQHKALLDLWYLQTNSSIDGALIIDGTITTGKLAFAVVSYSDWTNHTAIFILHTNNASAHHTRFANSEETDQVFTNWLDTSTVVMVETDPVHTNWLATNKYLKGFAEVDLSVPSGGFTVSITGTGTWYQLVGWTNFEDHTDGIDWTSSNVTFNVGGVTSPVHSAVLGSLSVEGPNAEIEYSYFLNGSKIDGAAVPGIFRDHGGAGSVGSISLTDTHDFSDGDVLDIRVRKDNGANGTLTVKGGKFGIVGFIE